MRIIAFRTLREFWEKSECSDSETSLRTWYHETKVAEWTSPNDIKAKYLSAGIIGNNRIVFNIKGNKYRLIVSIDYEFQVVFVRFIGTHKEYDKIDAKNI